MGGWRRARLLGVVGVAEGMGAGGVDESQVPGSGCRT